ncbi:MAG: hypothetical protein A4S09_07865 [Proteobacteria bacterium SG_bin7]|nr:MAG: hypothetical protein A4S09_07865 [Proteobacteria bacterium SG_bin7]
MIKPATLFSALIFISSCAHAIKLPSSSTSTSGDSELSELNLGIERSLYMDLFLFTGYAEFSHPNMSHSVAGSYSGIGGSIGTKIGWGFFGGITFDYRYMGQTSTVDNNHLNLSSTRFMPFAPMLGYRQEKYILKLDYQIAGNLEVSKSLSDGSTLKLNHPEGFRLIFIFDKWFGFAPIGLYYENVRFKEQSLSQSGITTLSRTFDTWQFGGLINVLF